MKQYVLGFVFDDIGQVLLVHKKKGPECVRGLLNGIGGSVEEGETTAFAMNRESIEETGLYLEWTEKGSFSVSGCLVRVFVAFVAGRTNFKPVNDVGEEQSFRHFEKCRSACVPNLTWLIPLCKSAQGFLIKEYS